MAEHFPFVTWTDAESYATTGQRARLLDGDKTTVHHDLGHADKRGRRIGANVTTWAAELVDPDTVAPGYPRIYRVTTTGRIWGFCPHATRDGRTFGPLQPDLYFPTEEERDQAVARYLAGARKRAAKAGR